MTLIEAVTEKLKPSRMKVSGKFTAMLAYILGQHGWTSPEIVEMAITSDGMLLVGDEDDPLLDQIVGSATDLEPNLLGVAEAADLTPLERSELLRLASARIKDWRRAA